MSERPIAVGDLVQVVRICCVAHLSNLSPVFRVEEIHDSAIKRSYARCSACKASLPIELYGSPVADQWGFPLSWLKRIPPLSELESTDETIKETV